MKDPAKLVFIRITGALWIAFAMQMLVRRQGRKFQKTNQKYGSGVFYNSE
jgi:hypothetical protein